MMLVDSHCHLDFPDLAENLPAVLDLMQRNEVAGALCMAMAALGVGIQFRGLREVGLKPGLLGLAATLVVSNIALGGVLLIG